jgi:hypothetical protein
MRPKRGCLILGGGTIMSVSTIPRWAGVGLLAYTLATLVAFMFSGAPGGDYADSDVVAYIAPGHAVTVFALFYVSALGALALVVFGAGVRRLPAIGQPLAALSAVGAAISVTGSLLAGGVAVATLEGGAAVRQGTPHAVVYLTTEIGHLMASCGPALAIGVAAIVLAVRAQMRMWLRVVAVVGGLCGILAPFYFTYFVYVLVMVILSIALLMGRTVRARMPEPSIV